MVFDRVFQQAEPIAQQYRSSLTAVQLASPPKGLRLKLRISAPELSQLPWEYLYNSRDDEWIGLQRRSPIIRFVEGRRPATELTVEGTLNILGMIANPRWHVARKPTPRRSGAGSTKPSAIFRG